MALKFFGQFLLEKGSITREMLLDAIKYQKEMSKPLCALAIEKGYLTQEQIESLDAEHRGSDKKFMEIAIRKKILSFQQLEELYKANTERWVFLGAALVERGHISLSQLNKFFAEYTQAASVGDSQIERILVAMPEREIISALLQVTVDLFVHYTKQVVQVVSAEVAEAKLADGVSYVFAQKVVGDKGFDYALALPEDLTLAIAGHMLGDRQVDVNPTVLDAVSEFVNVVIGNGCTKLSVKDVKVHAEPPRIITKESLAKRPPESVVAVNMKTTKQEFRVLFLFSRNPL